MTPDDLGRAWPGGVPGQGRLTLTLDPGAVAATVFLDVLAERFRSIADSLTHALSLVEPGFAVTLAPQPVEERRWVVDFSFSDPATDAMAWFLTAVETVAEEAGGGLFTHVDIDAAAGTTFVHRKVLPAVPPLPVHDAAGQRLAPDAIRRMTGAALYLSLPMQAAPPQAAALSAMLALSALVEEGCFGSIEVENDLSAPLVGHSPDGDEAHLGVTGFRGDPAVAPALCGLVAHLCGGALPHGTRLVLDHEDTV